MGERYDERDLDLRIKREFVLQHMWEMVLGVFIYKCILFKGIPGMSNGKSELVLWGISLVFSLVGLFFELKKEDVFLMQDMRIMFDLVIACGIYTVISYFGIHSSLIIIIFGMVIGLILVYAILVFARKIKKRHMRKKIIVRRIKKVCNISYFLTGLGMGVIMLVLYFGSLFRQVGMLFPALVASEQAEIEEQTIENNMDILIQLQNEVWVGLSEDERLKVLQTVANIETSYLGLPQMLTVTAEAGMEDYQWGYYIDNARMIVINRDKVNDETCWDALSVICHEAYHGYQYRIAEVFEGLGEKERGLLLFRAAEEYEKEFKSYINPDNNPIGYMEQDCEIDASEYASEAVEKYHDRMMDYLYGGEKEVGAEEQ